MGNGLETREPIDSATKTEAKDVSHLSSGDFYRAFRPFFRWSQIRKKSKLQNEKTMVGFGRTEVLIPPPESSSRDLSNGMVSGVLVLMGFTKVWFFMNSGPFL